MKLKSFQLKILLIIVAAGAILRFYNLNWGTPFYFHPDERNIADLISSLDSSRLDFLLKGTFAYGTFISNVVLFIKNLTAPFLSIFGFSDSFSQSIILLRIISSVSSTLTIAIVFLIGIKTLDWQKAFLAALLTASSAGLIQAAHFGVFESVLTLAYCLLLFVSLTYLKTKKPIYIYLSALITSLAAAIKINSMLLLIIPLGLLAIHIHSKKINRVKRLAYVFSLISISLLLTIAISPYYLTEKFRDMFFYEASLLTGSLPVFYTGEFFNTIPVLYQFTQILPFIINPILTILFIPILPYVLYRGFKKKNYVYLLTVGFSFILLLPNTLLFTKWTRYLVPLLPFMYLIISAGIVDFLDILPKKHQALKAGIMGVIVLTSIGFTIFYTSTAFIKDTRITASKWASENISSEARILSEVYDLGITPFNSYFPNIYLFNFYDLENNPGKKIELEEQLKNTEYIILPSQRLIKSRIVNRNKFRDGFNFYSDLSSEKLGFKKIYETPCDIFCKITYLGDPVFNFEQTVSVFDRPTVYIFKKENIK